MPKLSVSEGFCFLVNYTLLESINTLFTSNKTKMIRLLAPVTLLDVMNTFGWNTDVEKMLEMLQDVFIVNFSYSLYFSAVA